MHGATVPKRAAECRPSAARGTWVIGSRSRPGPRCSAVTRSGERSCRWPSSSSLGRDPIPEGLSHANRGVLVPGDVVVADAGPDHAAHAPLVASFVFHARAIRVAQSRRGRDRRSAATTRRDGTAASPPPPKLQLRFADRPRQHGHLATVRRRSVMTEIQLTLLAGCGRCR